MAHPTPPIPPHIDHDDRAHQARAAAALLGLLTRDLPVCTWIIGHADGMPLEGQLEHGDHTGLRVWADAFGAAVDWGYLNGRFPRTRFTLDGVAVHVWCGVAR